MTHSGLAHLDYCSSSGLGTHVEILSFTRKEKIDHWVYAWLYKNVAQSQTFHGVTYWESTSVDNDQLALESLYLNQQGSQIPVCQGLPLVTLQRYKATS